MEKEIRRVHFIGIGGSGMSGIALVAHKQGIRVTGSDLKESRYMKALLRAGIPVTVGHDVANVGDPSIDVVVVSTAIPERNAEYQAACEQGFSIWQRAQMLAYLARTHRTLAVAGTHGKTTTSSMLASSLDRLKASPTFLIGGVVDGYDATAHVGQGPWLVVEADESDGSFTWLDPTLAIITNIECDHMDHYGSLEEIEAAFASFLDQLRPDGIAVVCADDPLLPELARACGRRVVTYGLSEGAAVRCIPEPSVSSPPIQSPSAQDSSAEALPTPSTEIFSAPDSSVEVLPTSVAPPTGSLPAEGTRGFSVVFPDGERLSLALPASPGVHNMLNASAVMAALDALGFEREAAASAVSAFSGVRRRFDVIGKEAGVTVVDDYGHHPTEVAATLKAASELGYRRVHVLFQPHRYTRTEALFDQFACAFDYADTVHLLEVYSAGEAPIPGINSEALCEAIRAHDPSGVVCLVRHRPEAPEHMAGVARPGDLIITMGAGDITLIAPHILMALKQERLELPV
ncbi:MAG: UDP-N-acetylmuramate--L-alanine ligase [Coriobacteriales bacterium]|jgi:UDP-N-acetylmuramate--alanine ligase|nr:UDP-N-acetylmuramate--L-alanine ligase [Coriobacteriales bacterium]